MCPVMPLFIVRTRSRACVNEQGWAKVQALPLPVGETNSSACMVAGKSSGGSGTGGAAKDKGRSPDSQNTKLVDELQLTIRLKMKIVPVLHKVDRMERVLTISPIAENHAVAGRSKSSAEAFATLLQRRVPDSAGTAALATRALGIALAAGFEGEPGRAHRGLASLQDFRPRRRAREALRRGIAREDGSSWSERRPP